MTIAQMNDSIKQVIQYLLEGNAEDAKKLKAHQKNMRKSSKEKTSPKQMLASQPSEYDILLSAHLVRHPNLPISRMMLSMAEERVEHFFQYLNSEVTALFYPFLLNFHSLNKHLLLIQRLECFQIIFILTPFPFFFLMCGTSL